MGEASQEQRLLAVGEDAGSTAEPADLDGVLAQMGVLLLSAETVGAALRLVTELAAATVPGSVGAGVSVMDDRGKRSAAASDELVLQADALQYEFDSGPCLTAWRDQVLVRVDDVSVESRWPQWTAAVGRLGVASVLSTPLVAGPDSMGAIKVYGTQAGVFDAHARRVLQLFAQQAAILLATTRSRIEARQLTAQLTAALQSRDLIGQAKGILMAQGAADGDAAFAMLASASQRSNTKLSEVAGLLVESVVRRQQSPAGGSSGPSPTS